jgi:hypothetical protein
MRMRLKVFFLESGAFFKSHGAEDRAGAVHVGPVFLASGIVVKDIAMDEVDI